MQQDSEFKWFEFLRLSSEVHLWEFILKVWDCHPLCLPLICILTKETKLQNKILGPQFYKCVAKVPCAGPLPPFLSLAYSATQSQTWSENTGLYRSVFSHSHLPHTPAHMHSRLMLQFIIVSNSEVLATYRFSFVCLAGFFFLCHQSCSYWWYKVAIF